jgi:hypothetical protein
MFGWLWKRHAATNKEDLLRRIADGKITKAPPRRRWGPPRYMEHSLTLPVLGSLAKRDLTEAEILMLGNIRRGAMDSSHATDKDLAESRMDLTAGDTPRTRPIITRRKYYSAGIPAADQGTYMSKLTYVADDFLGQYCDSRNKIYLREEQSLGSGPLFQFALRDGFANYLTGPKKPFYIMVLNDGHVGCILLQVSPFHTTLSVCVEAFNLSTTDVYRVVSCIKGEFRSRRHSLYQIVLQVPVRELDYDRARLFTRALQGTITERLLQAFPNGQTANEDLQLNVQTDPFDIHCQTWIIIYPILRVVMGKSVLVTSRWFESIVGQRGHRFIDEARATLVELASDPPRALKLIKTLIATVAHENPRLKNFSSSV